MCVLVSDSEGPVARRVCVCAVTTQDFQLLGVSSDGFASLRDLSTGAIDESLRLPPPVNLRRNNKEEDDAYLALVGFAHAYGPYIWRVCACLCQSVVRTRLSTFAGMLGTCR